MSTLTPVSDVFLEKSPPSNVEAERMILGCALLDPNVFEQAETLKPDEFFLPSHRKIFAAMARIWKKGLDPLTLQEELRRVGEFDQIGGPAYIASLFDGVPRFSRIENYIRIVQDKYRLRCLIKTASAMINRAFDDEDSPDEQVAQAERELAGIGDKNSASRWRSAGRVFSDYIAQVQERADSESPVVGFSTGFYALDRLTLGFERKLHTVIGARPAVGKTALGLSLTLYLSMSRWNLDADGRPPLIAWFSMEMPAEQLMRRLIAILASVDLRALHLGRLSPDEWRRVSDADLVLTNLRIHFDDRCGLSVSKIRQALRMLKQQEGQTPDIVITDYLQLGDGDRQKGQSRAEEVARFCAGMTQVFKEQSICGISLAQLNRDAHGNKPALRDFKESGQIEQDASVVIGLHRPEVDNPSMEPTGKAELILLKQRNGPPASVEVGFDGARTWFFE
jgi:replicative DNA helicase